MGADQSASEAVHRYRGHRHALLPRRYNRAVPRCHWRCRAQAARRAVRGGLWPVSLAPALEASVKTGMRKVQAWVADHDAEQIFFPRIDIGGRNIDPFFNINRPEDLAEAEALLKAATR